MILDHIFFSFTSLSQQANKGIGWPKKKYKANLKSNLISQPKTQKQKQKISNSYSIWLRKNQHYPKSRPKSSS